MRMVSTSPLSNYLRGRNRGGGALFIWRKFFDQETRVDSVARLHLILPSLTETCTNLLKRPQPALSLELMQDPQYFQLGLLICLLAEAIAVAA